MTRLFNKFSSINRSIFLLWLGQLISHAGDAIYMIALPWLILELTGSKTTTSLIAVCAYLPAVLFSLPAGVIVDRFNRRAVMIFSDAARMITIAGLVIFLLTGGVSPLVIGTIAFIVASFSTLFYPARDSLIPSLIPKQSLTSANAFISTSGQFAHLAGPVIAGVLITLVGLTHLFTLDAISFTASMICILFIVQRKKETIGKKSPHPHLHDLKEGLNYVIRKRPLAFLLLLTAVNNLFIMGPAMIGTPIFVREVLQMKFAAYATIEAFMAGGMIIGSILVWKIGKNFNPSLVLFIGMIMDGLTYSCLYFIHTYPGTKLLILIHGIGIPMITISRTTIIQKVVPDRFRGRIFSMVNMSVIGLTAISSGLIGPFAEILPIGTIFLVIGIGAALCGVIGLNHRGLMKLVD
ncbi:MAG: MFS transporter [Candidatus Marinimicrobia bacterium]|nr:MFS transporter [Candidatus Neomarinimicrobiota bacterium]